MMYIELNITCPRLIVKANALGKVTMFWALVELVAKYTFWGLILGFFLWFFRDWICGILKERCWGGQSGCHLGNGKRPPVLAFGIILYEVMVVVEVWKWFTTEKQWFRVFGEEGEKRRGFRTKISHMKEHPWWKGRIFSFTTRCNSQCNATPTQFVYKLTWQPCCKWSLQNSRQRVGICAIFIKGLGKILQYKSRLWNVSISTQKILSSNPQRK